MSFAWKTAKRELDLRKPLVMAILNITPDSFSDGGEFRSIDAAIRQAEKLIGEGADILDIGGESTRPGSQQVSAAEEIRRVVPVIEALSKRFDTPISIDTTKSEVVSRSVDAGAEIINDISGLRFDERIAAIAASSGAGLILMHSRGEFESMHSQPPVNDIFADVASGFRRSLRIASDRGVSDEQIALDIGLGFGKTFEQNLDLIAKLDKIVDEFSEYPLLVGASRKSFIGRICIDRPTNKRLAGSLAAAVIAVQNGARVVRVHDVAATVDALLVEAAIRDRIREL